MPKLADHIDQQELAERRRLLRATRLRERRVREKNTIYGTLLLVVTVVAWAVCIIEILRLLSIEG